MALDTVRSCDELHERSPVPPSHPLTLSVKVASVEMD